MTNFGGLGGVQGGRAVNPDDSFEMAVDRAFGEQLRAERSSGADNYDEGWFNRKGLGARLWGSLANVDWVHENGDTAGYSFRAAGDLIAAIVGTGDYMDWYCSADYGHADAEIVERLAREGWRPDENA